MRYRGLFVGLTTVDIQYFVNDYPQVNKKIKTNPPDVLVGGPATNAAVVFAHLNGEADLGAVVGKNAFTTFIYNDLAEHKINKNDFAALQQINPVIASVVTSGNGDRNIFTHNPVALSSNFNAEKLLEKLNPQVLLLDGFYPEIALKCAELAQKRKIPVVLDCGSWKPQYEKLLQLADVAICSADFYPPGCKTEKDVFAYLKRLGITKSAISRGNKSILFVQNEELGEVEVPQTNVVDTLGAGDFLHGAFCYYFLDGGDFKTALKEAGKIATLSCSYKGTRMWLKNI